jgi:uncharacterized membrane protein YkoI
MLDKTLAAILAAAAITVLAAGTAGAQSEHPTTHARVTGDAKLRAEAKVNEAAARATALKEVPSGTIRSGELEREHGKLIYSFDIKVAGKSGIEEVNVDAITGAVVAHEHETPKAEKAEAVKEAKEKKAASKP